jgi:DNA processing protein
MVKPDNSAIAVQVLALLKYGKVAPKIFDLLLQHYGSPAGILEASSASLRELPGVSTTAATRISATSRKLTEAEKYIGELKHRGIFVLTRFDDNYGHLLFELNDPPPLLYVRGHLPVPQERSVTLVGSRNASAEGIALTTRVAQQFAQAHVQIVSSLDGGNDSAAHLGAKAAGGRSFALLDTGFDELDQTTQVPLAIDVALTGGVITEFAPDHVRAAASLETVDRLLVGMSQATVLTEVYQDSRREHDLLKFCHEIGKMAFVVVDEEMGPLADKESLVRASECGAILMHGQLQIADIARSLV